MAAPLLIVVQGAPGTGKTTLVKKLRQDLSIPMLGKDDIKEFLFDLIPQSDRDFSRLQGGASFEMLYAFARTFLESGHSVLIEGAFHAEYARPHIRDLIRTSKANSLELFCHVDEAVRRERFHARALSGARHSAHMDLQTGKEVHRAVDPFEPLGLDGYIDVDAIQPIDEGKYAEIVNRIKERAA